ncbi:hypothetical protein B0H13DRAFT_1486094, partial [Mycena leptocephala]
MALEDLKAVDAELYRRLKWNFENHITDVLDDTFTTTEERLGQPVTIELVPNGRNIPLTEQNKREYVNAAVSYRLNRHPSEAF